MKRFSCGHSLLIGVDKPLGLSSHDVVARVRRAVGESKVGHAGTLDPLASGVLVVGIGQATRLLGLITLDDKRYLARISFGSQTSTDDAEGEVIRTAPIGESLRDEGFARAALARIVGVQEQVPPAYSAISVDGARAYARARKGEDVDLPARTVTVHDAALISVDAHDGDVAWVCSFHVSKGAYIRSLARDLGSMLDSAAHLSGLTRTSSGAVGLDRCIDLDTLAEGGLEAARAAALDPLTLLSHQRIAPTDAELAAIMNGRQLSADICPGLAQGEDACLTRDGRLWSIVTRTGDRLATAVNFPQGIEGVRA